MSFALPLLLLLVAQDEKRPFAQPEEDEIVRGLPDGDIAPVPEQVDWNLARAIAAKTHTRERINLAGPWRFAPVLEKESPVARAEMGWLHMPDVWTTEGARVLDARLREADGLWRGRPLDKYAHAWVERDLVIRNDDTIKWLNHRIFLVLRGPWSGAEVYVSQRFKKPPAPDSNADDPPRMIVHAEQATGVEREDGRWFELTEMLAYPGSNQISLRLHTPDRAGDADATPVNSKPSVSLELLPSRPRVDAIRLRRDAASGEIEATIELVRPLGFVLIPGPPVKTIPMTLKLRLDDVEKDVTIQKLDEAIGPIVNTERRVVLRIPWSAEKGQSPPKHARIRLRLDATGGGIFDEMYPVEFKPDELMPVD
jgi:hypothetical protein